MFLQNKAAVVYGAGGAIGGAVARAFAAEGADVYLTGRRLGPVDAVAKEIAAAGGSADATEVDALDEEAIGRHLRSVVERAGRVDVSFNAVGVPGRGLIGTPLVELDAERFDTPIAEFTRSYFLTATAAARHMLPNRSGVIMTVTPLLSRAGTQLNGGYGAAAAAKEALTRDLSAELGPQGLRVVGLRPAGIPESSLMREVFASKPSDLDWEQFQGYLAGMNHTGRVMVLDEVAGAAVFAASDRAGGLTGTTLNLTMGTLDD
ncbi:SDR family NAD(P)-dependent oxidoreductase [Yinghuangia seranimata]|uniref:SDR family NAD(P)-dependent oxidoreductase n=1 Tax=Yinghuangia seranimata TaxID=408067 RepID=UPI00248AA1D3|nr:SDR family oxidoreductase [Yinghuangia seranimata]MDI2131048.1 SDR family oxidoreductase [Yinghuangia seranimata]